MKAAKAAIPIAFAVLAPITLIMGFSSADTETSAALNAKAAPSQYMRWVQQAGQECKEIPAPVIAAQIDSESGWNPKAKSDAGAEGISQMMPGTWKKWGQDVAHPDGTPKPDGIKDPYTPGDAIIAQGKLDCWLADKVTQLLKAGKATGDPVALTLAAYNAGLDSIKFYGGVPPFPKTQSYVKRITALTSQYTAVTSPGTGFGARVVAAADEWRGTPYQWGGNCSDPKTEIPMERCDCSSLVQYAVEQASNGTVLLPRTTQQQVETGKAVLPDQIKPGDAIYFDLSAKAPGYDHVGLYIGNGRMIHAPKTGSVVKYSDFVTDPYYSSKAQQIRRFG